MKADTVDQKTHVWGPFQYQNHANVESLVKIIIKIQQTTIILVSNHI